MELDKDASSSTEEYINVFLKGIQLVRMIETDIDKSIVIMILLSLLCFLII